MNRGKSNNFLRIKACIFDAYGTLFDFNSAVDLCSKDIGDKSEELSNIWRQKQIQYTWLRSMMNKYADFWQVTGDALDYAMSAVSIKNEPLQKNLMQLYKELEIFPEVNEVLNNIKNENLKIAILSNGTQEMLFNAINHSNLNRLIDMVISVDEIGVYKPSPKVYQLAINKLKLNPEEICFISSNAWDAHGASSFGFKVIWINRYQLPHEKIPTEPDKIISSLLPITNILGLETHV